MKCQSCGMPVKQGQAGSEADGGDSVLYCHHCYQQGRFVQPNISLKQMQQLCIEKMQEMGIPKPIGWLWSRSLTKLQRWRKQM